jgi:excisionase family DNA binding protein
VPKPGGALVKIQHASKALGLTNQTLRKWIRKGTLAGEKIGGRWYVHRVALDRMLATQLSVE